MEDLVLLTRALIALAAVAVTIGIIAGFIEFLYRRDRPANDHRAADRHARAEENQPGE